jgi:hypothetical protein
MNRILFPFFIILLFFSIVAQGQNPKPTIPLHHFFLDNFDSTLIYHNWFDYDSSPDYYIFTKKDGNVFLFRYTNPYPLFLGYPVHGGLSQKFIRERLKYQHTLPDTNQYFLSVSIPAKERETVWNKVNAFGIWKLESFNDEPHGCFISHAQFDTYYLITKESYKAIQFYGADYYEECSPSNVNRKQEIQTRNAIKSIFCEKAAANTCLLP